MITGLLIAFVIGGPFFLWYMREIYRELRGVKDDDYISDEDMGRLG